MITVQTDDRKHEIEAVLNQRAKRVERISYTAVLATALRTGKGRFIIDFESVLRNDAYL